MSIDSFLAVMGANGGMSLSNSFVVKVENPNIAPFDAESDNYIINPSGNGNIFEFLCDEAQLPNTQAATGTLKGRYMGEGQVNYPHTRIFTEFQLGFQCDANMTPLKFLNQWYNSIFREYAEDGHGYSQMDDAEGTTPEDGVILSDYRVGNRTVALSYPDEYCRKMYVTKTERGPARAGGIRSSITYCMDRAWPFAIDAVPLQFGSGQITKVTAQFYYTKHKVISHNINGYPQELDPDDPAAGNFGTIPGVRGR